LHEEVGMTSNEHATADELAIRTLVARYADAVMRRDASLLGVTYAPDAVWDLAGTVAAGGDEIVALWQRLMAKFDLVLQTVHSGTVTVNGDQGTGRWYVSELNRNHRGDGSLMVGVYDDSYVRLGSGWRFSSRRFRFLYRGPADVSGTGDAVAALAELD
jgi:ketosteroid isomerase-like protein